VPRMFARNRVDSHFSTTAFHGARCALETRKGGESIVTFTDLVTYLRARFGVEEGQTMAEYGVVLAVITLAGIAAITLLSNNVRNEITSVANILPGG
jgi:Flp pilus assembly pilin Flp